MAGSCATGNAGRTAISSEPAPPRVVAFFGPDGAGKSTLLGLVEAGLGAHGVLHCRTYYFAPGFLKRYRPKGEPVCNHESP